MAKTVFIIRAQIWNSLNASIHAATSLAQFKQLYTSIFSATDYLWVHLFYVCMHVILITCMFV